MSPATKDIIARVRQMIPPMLEKFHKGQLGRVGVIGGSEDYTGAPYFSAMASARLGCDMVGRYSCTPISSPLVVLRHTESMPRRKRCDAVPGATR
ncbi:hypothetical protein CHGG_01124 [Chaetomium globosum CBS 148.51]|uniref:YjeF C-terminal domain-containing protein n=1 Tax=Chaetomium globosum (strain ATCC 6205 / CBS 148.51 / DSM 1962 / NBRC 6347 / NRRL 1970) TaxID=306901 RepID=Q2HF80_CHAGB|nr:uncharacterized protein CHGG_01124 [Chaetomium globosum CBS 148.51]EAQ92889.1 hypothetical protein CHGG_01124 [Chaetomium globosum CBS 148.51]